MKGGENERKERGWGERKRQGGKKVGRDREGWSEGAREGIGREAKGSIGRGEEGRGERKEEDNQREGWWDREKESREIGRRLWMEGGGMEGNGGKGREREWREMGGGERVRRKDGGTREGRKWRPKNYLPPLHVSEVPHKILLH